MTISDFISLEYDFFCAIFFAQKSFLQFTLDYFFGCQVANENFKKAPLVVLI
jgi:hypothetical protein